MKLKALLAALSAASLLVACGGGGSDAGSTPFGTGAGTGLGSDGSTGGTGAGTGGSTGGSGTVPGSTVPSTATAMTFEEVTPADQPLLIQGATASGRTDSATLKFKVVDQVGAVVPGQKVNFSVSPPSAVTLNITSSSTDASGIVETSVTSKTVPTTVVVTAVLESNSAVRAVSNSLNISGGDPVQQAFEIVAEQYNLDGRFVGANTKVSAFVGDENGNPVADGFAVNFTANAGQVEGGCTTVNGTCNVTFRVQAPYGSGIATITGTGGTGGTTVSDTVSINMAGSSSTTGYQLSEVSTGSPVTTLSTLNSCKQDVIYYLSDGSGRAAAAGSTITVATTSGGATATVKLGSPVTDALDGAFSPTIVVVSYDLSSLTAAKKCDITGTSTASEAAATMLLKTPNGVEKLQSISLSYPYKLPAP